MGKMILFLFSFFYCLNAEIVTGEKIAYPVESKNLFEEGIVRVTVIVKDGKIKSKDFYEPYNFRFKKEIESKISNWKFGKDGKYNIEVNFRLRKEKCSHYNVKTKILWFWTKNTTIKSCVGEILENSYLYDKQEEIIESNNFLIKIIVLEKENTRAQK